MRPLVFALVPETLIFAFEVYPIYPNGLWPQLSYSRRMPAVTKADKHLCRLIPATAVMCGDFFRPNTFLFQRENPTVNGECDSTADGSPRDRAQDAPERGSKPAPADLGRVSLETDRHCAGFPLFVEAAPFTEWRLSLDAPPLVGVPVVCPLLDVPAVLLRPVRDIEDLAAVDRLYLVLLVRVEVGSEIQG